MQTRDSHQIHIVTFRRLSIEGNDPQPNLSQFHREIPASQNLHTNFRMSLLRQARREFYLDLICVCPHQQRQFADLMDKSCQCSLIGFLSRKVTAIRIEQRCHLGGMCPRHPHKPIHISKS